MKIAWRPLVLVLVLASLVMSQLALPFSEEPGGAQAQNIAVGVPDYPVDYSKDVEAWWAGHPFNPENPNYIPIGAIQNLPGLSTINVRQQYGGNLQSAIDAL